MPLKTKKHKLRSAVRKEKTMHAAETSAAHATVAASTHFRNDVTRTIILTFVILSLEVLLFLAGQNGWLPIPR